MITPKGQTDIKAQMEFRGINQTTWIVSSTILTTLCLGTAVAAYVFYDGYINTPRFCKTKSGEFERCPDADYNRPFFRYRTALYTSIGIGCLSGISWTFTGFNIFKNKEIKRSFYSRNK